MDAEPYNATSADLQGPISPHARWRLYLSSITLYPLLSAMHSFTLTLREGRVGVIPPPAGVTPNFVDPPSLKHVILITNVIFPVISAMFLAFRFYTTALLYVRWAGFPMIHMDPY